MGDDPHGLRKIEAFKRAQAVIIILSSTGVRVNTPKRLREEIKRLLPQLSPSELEETAQLIEDKHRR